MRWYLVLEPAVFVPVYLSSKGPHAVESGAQDNTPVVALKETEPGKEAQFVPEATASSIVLS